MSKSVLDKRTINRVRRRMERIYNTRITGLDWFQVFEYGSGKPIEALGNPKGSLHINKVTAICTQLLYFGEQILKMTTSIGSGVEELVLVCEKQKLFLFQLENLGIVLVSNERIGDVCYHSAWQVSNSELSVRPFLRDLHIKKTAYDPQEIYKQHTPYRASSLNQEFLKHAFPLFDNSELILITDPSGGTYCCYPDEGKDKHDEFAGYIGLQVTLAQRLAQIVEEGYCNLGKIQEIIIGREGAREKTGYATGGGSLVINCDSPNANSSFTVVSAAPLGKTLYMSRLIKAGATTYVEQPARLDSLKINYRGVEEKFQQYSSKVRNRKINQITFDKEKLVWFTDYVSGIDSLETPDVLGALLDEGKSLAAKLRHVIGEIRTIEIKVENLGKGEEGTTWVVASPVNASISCLTIAEEHLETIRETVKGIVSELQSSFKGSPFDSETEQLSLDFPEFDGSEIEKPFSLHRAVISFDTTPYRTVGEQAILEPVKTDGGIGVYDSLKSSIVLFVDRARIFVQFILKKHRQAWSVSIRGTEGSFYCQVRPEGRNFTIFAGSAKDRKLSNVVNWVEKNAEEWVSQEDEEDRDREASIDFIAEQFAEKQCVLFIGPELSSDYGLPTPSQLATIMTGKLREAKTSTSLGDASYKYEQRFGRSGLVDFLIANIKIDKRLDIKDSDLTSTIKLPARLFITSNFDKVLETIVEKTHKRPEIILPGHKVAKLTGAREISVLKLFGDPNDSEDSGEQKLIITTADLTGFTDRKEYMASLDQLIKNNTVVFIGCNPKDSNFKNVDYVLRGKNKEYPRRSFLISSLRVGDQTKWDWRGRGVEILKMGSKEFFDRINEKIGKRDMGAIITPVNMLFLLS